MWLVQNICYLMKYTSRQNLIEGQFGILVTQKILFKMWNYSWKCWIVLKLIMVGWWEALKLDKCGWFYFSWNNGIVVDEKWIL